MNELSTDLFETSPRTPGRVSEGRLFQGRPNVQLDYAQYRFTHRLPTAYVHSRVLEEIRRCTVAALPNETIGMLLGRVCEDERGIYVLVMAAGAATAREHTGTPGFVQISAAGKASLRARCTDCWPGWEVVGWWHSHPRGVPRFSHEDMLEQSAQGANHVGIVAAAEHYTRPETEPERQATLDGGVDACESNDPLGVYIGPESVRLERHAEPRAPRHALPTNKPQLPSRAGLPRQAPRPIAPRALLAVLAILTILTGTVLAAWWTQSEVRHDFTQSAARVGSTSSTVAPAPGEHSRSRLVLGTAAACAPGERLQLPVILPGTATSEDLATTSNSTVALASLSRAGRSLLVSCVAPGRTIVGVTLPGDGAEARIPVVVSSTEVLQ